MTATSTCSKLISQGYEKACSHQAKKGFLNESIIFNYDDIDWNGVVVGDEANIIKTLPLLSGGKQGYKIVQFTDPFTGTVKSLATGKYVQGWNKTFKFVTLTRDQSQALNLTDPLANGKFVVIVQNVDGGADGKATFEILGFHNGLKLTACDNDPYSDDVFSGEVFQLEEKFAEKNSMFLWNTDYATTKTAFTSYLTATGLSSNG